MQKMTNGRIISRRFARWNLLKSLECFRKLGPSLNLVLLTSCDYNLTKATSRWATEASGQAWVDGVNNYQHVVPSLGEHHWYENKDKHGKDIPVERQCQKTLAEAMSLLILPGYLDEYEAFSTAQFTDNSKPVESLSLEDVHNNLHGWVGGIGHMSNVPTSAFDPIFWLHHANYDRLLALWQQTHPGKRIKESYEGDCRYAYKDGNWSISECTIVGGDTDLMPFFREVEGKNVPFKSKDVEDFAQYGYTYPLLGRQWRVPYDEKNRDKDIGEITKAVNEAYGTIRATLPRKKMLSLKSKMEGLYEALLFIRRGKMASLEM
ncbi:hypothetical protein TWF281_010548 [Arthrobotrys megalospora]